ncbi:MAG TPA: hypothetical protein VF669_18820, partial [Tepidisphaeraceae bacterium]
MKWRTVPLDPERIELFVEAAALPGYFDDLGNYHREKSGSERRRREVLIEVLDEAGVAPEIFHRHPDLFKTTAAKSG